MREGVHVSPADEEEISGRCVWLAFLVHTGSNTGFARMRIGALRTRRRSAGGVGEADDGDNVGARGMQCRRMHAEVHGLHAHRKLGGYPCEDRRGGQYH